MDILKIEMIIPLILGFVLDFILGDPHRLPHPIRWFGNAISFGTKKLNGGKNKLFKGAVMSLILILSTYFLLFSFEHIISSNVYVLYAFNTLFVYYGLANRSLIVESLKVERALQKEGLEKARQQLSMIVGRDTGKLNGHEIRKATLETLAENLSDGVVAPLFYYAIGGVPLMLAYKMVNTLDSMIGYKNEKYIQFGKVAAVTDDMANYIPARITAMLMVLATFSYRAMKFVFLYGNKHSSPNAGYPESALAGILNCRFGGPARYHGIVVDKPYIGSNNRGLTNKDVIKAVRINMKVAISMLVLVWVMVGLLY